MKKRPNIVIINPDQMRADSMFHLGNPAAVTPNLDELAKEGVSFAHAFCQNPVCTPSRLSLIHIYLSAPIPTNPGPVCTAREAVMAFSMILSLIQIYEKTNHTIYLYLSGDLPV